MVHSLYGLLEWPCLLRSIFHPKDFLHWVPCSLVNPLGVKWVNIGSDNGVSLVWRQAITWTTASFFNLSLRSMLQWNCNRTWQIRSYAVEKLLSNTATYIATRFTYWIILCVIRRNHPIRFSLILIHWTHKTLIKTECSGTTNYILPNLVKSKIWNIQL